MSFRLNTRRVVRASLCAGLLIILSACGGGSSSSSGTDVGANEAFTLNFAAEAGQMEVSCLDTYPGYGEDADTALMFGDIRFFVSDLTFYDAQGDRIPVTLDATPFQYQDENGEVSLVDILGTTGGVCEEVAEATARTNSRITGTIESGRVVDRVEFDVGVPPAMMQAMVAAGPVEDAPSPLSELNWSWAGGYRYLAVNFAAMNPVHTAQVPNSAFHVGSTDCGGNLAAGKLALSDRDTCGFPNIARVALDAFNPDTDTVTLDMDALFSGIQNPDLVKDVWEQHGGDETVCVDARRNGGWCVVGQSFGLQCHSGQAQTACGSLFPSLGLTLATGAADASQNSAFRKAN